MPYLDLSDQGDITNEQFEKISELKHLRSIDLNGCTFQPEGLDYLSPLPQLDNINFGNLAKLSIEHLQRLKRFETLNQFTLSRFKIERKHC